MFSSLLDQCSQVVTKEMNQLLLADVTLEEVKSVIFQLGASKALGHQWFVLSAKLDRNLE